MRAIKPFIITDATLTSSSVPETDYAAWSSATTYALNDYVISTSSHKIYKSLQAANLNNALTDTAWWSDQGFVNRWRAFDSITSTITSQATSINWVITPTEIVDSIALLNFNATSITITVTDTIDGLVYNQTFDTTDLSNVYDSYTWWFAPILRKNNMVITGLPTYFGAAISITVTNIGGTATIGNVVLGQLVVFGDTELGMSIGIKDYSVKSADAFGNYVITQRSFVKRARVNVWVDKIYVDYINKLLSDYRATPLVYIGSDNDSYESSIIYGFYNDYDILIQYHDISELQIQIEGL